MTMIDDNDIDLVFAGSYEKVPDGIYKVKFVRAERKKFHDHDKIYLWFEIVDIGTFSIHRGKQIFLSCNVVKPIHRSSKYYKNWVIANGGKEPKRNDRMSTKAFANKAFKIKTRTVTKGYLREDLSEESRYSVVDEIVELVEELGKKTTNFR